MTWTEAYRILAAVLASFGGAAIIVAVLAKFFIEHQLAKAQEKLKSDYAHQLAATTSDLHKQSEAELAKLRSALDRERTISLGVRSDKIATYRAAIDVIAEILSHFDLGQIGGKMPAQLLQRFNQERVKAYGYMAMLSPQSVMDAFSSLEILLIDVAAAAKPYDWKEVRRRSLVLLNEIRKDIESGHAPVLYHGEDHYRKL